MQEPIPGAEPVELPLGPWGRMVMLASQLLAVTGGLVFVGLVVMSIVSITGRKLIATPVPGDVEVLQMLAASASASFFAFCHLKRGDVKVDFFTAKASPRTLHVLDGIGSLLMAGFGALLTWRAGAGAMTTLDNGETSAILAWPVGWAQVALLPGFAMLCLAGLYAAFQHAQAWRTEARAA
jgi:TRAP-type C4-dicarboxylate transport system permease small subunit